MCLLGRAQGAENVGTGEEMSVDTFLSHACSPSVLGTDPLPSGPHLALSPPEAQDALSPPLHPPVTGPQAHSLAQK